LSGLKAAFDVLDDFAFSAYKDFGVYKLCGVLIGVSVKPT
jgi:hypothetical protein